jgi:hypothetical protein
MKISVMANGMVKVEGSTLAEEVEMRNKLQAQGKTCTPIEYEGSVQGCLDWIMGKSESELDEVTLVADTVADTHEFHLLLVALAYADNHIVDECTIQTMESLLLLDVHCTVLVDSECDVTILNRHLDRGINLL